MRLPFRILYVNFYCVLLMGFFKIIAQGILANRNNYWNDFILAFFIILILFIIAFLQFYFAFRGFFYDQSVKIIYKFAIFILFAFTICNLILFNNLFDGLGRIIKLTNEKEDFLSFLLITEFITSCIIFINCLVGAVTFYRFEKKFDTN